MSTEATVDARRTDTRERILEVAAHLFAERGFAGTSIRDIADALGVTKAALYYHFASKDDILQAIVDLPIANVRAVLAESADLSSPQSRRDFVKRVIFAMAECSADSLAIFKDPQLAGVINMKINDTGITNVLAVELAKALSGVDDPAQVQPDHLMRAAAAVAAGNAVIDTWHVAYPDHGKFTSEAVDYIADVVASVLER